MMEYFKPEIAVTIPNNSRGLFCSKYRDNIEQFLYKKEIWIGILNKSLSEDIAIKKEKIFGFLVIKINKKFNVKHETSTNNQKKICKATKKKIVKEMFLKQV